MLYHEQGEEKEVLPSHRASPLPDPQTVTSLVGAAAERTEKKHNDKEETLLLEIHLKVKWEKGGRSIGD